MLRNWRSYCGGGKAPIDEAGVCPLMRLKRRVGRMGDNAERLWSRLTGPFGPLQEPEFLRQMRYPRADVLEADDKVRILFDVPGFAAEDISVSVEGRTLRVSGSRSGKAAESEKIVSSERGVGCFEREIDLPKGLDLDHIAARVADGVLTVEIPRLPGPERKVEVRAD